VGSTRGAAAASMSPPHTTASRRGSTARAGHGQELRWPLRPPPLLPQPQAKVLGEGIIYLNSTGLIRFRFHCRESLMTDEEDIEKLG